MTPVHSGRGRASRGTGDEAAALAREVLTTSGDIIPRDGRLVRPDPLTAPRCTRALAALCDQPHQHPLPRH